MKSRFFLILAIIALVGFLVSIDNGNVCAQQENPPEPFDSTKAPVPVEFSTDTLCSTLYGDVDQNAIPDPQQVLYTEAWGRNWPIDAFDYDDVVPYVEGEVDALANGQDALFTKIADPSGRRANLLVSFEHDPVWTLAPGLGNIAVYLENAARRGFPLWSHLALDVFGIVLPDDSLELDAMEVWGGPVFDADYFSKIGDPDPGVGFKVSVFYFSPATGTTPYVPHSDIVTAVTHPAMDENGGARYEGDPYLVDLDGLMVWDAALDREWNTGDTIIFSIRAAGNWDGGEIVVLPFGGPPRYLFHDGHFWNTVFPVAATFDLATPTEEVDAIEAFPWYGGCRTPTLTQWGLIILIALLVVSTVFVMLRRRKAAVPA